MSLAKANRLGFIRRCASREKKAWTVAECQQPGAGLKMIAQRNWVAVNKLRGWVRLAGGAAVAKLEREDAAAQPPFVPVVVDDRRPDRTDR